MSKGFPDYLGLSTFPQYGILLHSQASPSVASGVTSTILSISDKGLMIKYHLLIAGAVTHENDVVYLDIDGVTYSGASLIGALQAGAIGCIPDGAVMQNYRFKTFTYTMRMNTRLPFVDSIAIRVKNNSSESCTYYISCDYYKLS